MTEENKLSYERCMELLNSVIDHATVAHNTKETIQELLYSGFTTDELVHVFNFSEDDVNEAYEELE